MAVRWRCKTCGALLDGNAALGVVLSNFFVPVQVEEKERTEPRHAPSVSKPSVIRPPKHDEKEDYGEEEEEDEEDLKLD